MKTLGQAEILRHIISTSALDRGDGHLPALATLFPQKEPPLPINQVSRWAPEMIGDILGKKELSGLC